MYRYEWKYGNEDFDACRAIRTAVFVEEQEFEKEFDEIDPIAWHVVIWDGIQAVATGRIFSNKDGSYTIGRVAVLKNYRGTGVGSTVIQSLESKARELRAPSIHLSAQLQAVGFYQKMGYHPEGKEYLDEFCPHISMVKILSEK